MIYTILAYTPGVDKMFDVRPFVLIVSIGTIGGFILFAAIKNYRQWKKINAAPEYTVRAELTRKYVDLEDNGENYRGKREEVIPNKTVYKVDFNLLRKKQKVTLLVHAGEYDALREGSRGILKYKGNICLCYTEDSGEKKAAF